VVKLAEENRGSWVEDLCIESIPVGDDSKFQAQLLSLSGECCKMWMHRGLASRQDNALEVPCNIWENAFAILAGETDAVARCDSRLVKTITAPQLAVVGYSPVKCMGFDIHWAIMLSLMNRFPPALSSSSARRRHNEISSAEKRSWQTAYVVLRFLPTST